MMERYSEENNSQTTTDVSSSGSRASRFLSDDLEPISPSERNLSDGELQDDDDNSDHVDEPPKKRTPRSEYVLRPSRNGSPKYPLIDLICNFFKVTIPNIKVYVYDVRMNYLYKDSQGEWKPLYNEHRKDEMRRLKKLLNENNRRVMAKVAFTHAVPGGLFCYGKDPIHPVFDGNRNIYTVKPLTLLHEVSKTSKDRESKCKNLFKEKVEIEMDTGSMGTFEVTIRYATSVNLKEFLSFIRGDKDMPPSDVLKALDIILQNGPMCSDRSIPIGQGIVRTDFMTKELSAFKILAYGFFKTLRGTISGPCLILDRFTSCFYKEGSLLDIMKKIKYPERVDDIDTKEFLRDLTNNDIRKIEKELQGMKVSTNHANYKRSFKISRFSFLGAKEETFQKTENGATFSYSVANYFEERYGRPLKHPEAPCLIAGPPNRRVFFPVEVIDVAPHQTTGRLSSVEKRKVIAFNSLHSTRDRFNIISDSVRAVVKDSAREMAEFRYSIDTEPTHMQGLILPHPALTYDPNDKPFIPLKGRWDMEQKGVFSSAIIQKWAVINLDPDIGKHLIMTFIDKVRHVASDMKIELPPPIIDQSSRSNSFSSASSRSDSHSRQSHDELPYFDFTRPAYRSGDAGIILDNLLRKTGNIDLLVCIFIDKNDDMYRDIKYVCDCKEGVISQCVSGQSILDMNLPSSTKLLPNIILQMNAKLGGINCAIDDSNVSDKLKELMSRKTMIIGGDVTHGSVSDNMQVSIAAITASMDSRHYRYRSTLRVQDIKVEIINNRSMEDMIMELLHEFKRRNHMLPKRIIYYRDGVADNMFRELIDIEIEGMRCAIRHLYRDSSDMPKVTVIVVQKRHHTRFIPANDEDGVGKGKNVPGGTLIEEEIVHPKDFDFYLCSHDSPLGTARSAHYRVLWDDCSFDRDTLYQLTFNMCHIYAPSTQSMSIPVPVQYAHLAAKRARIHLRQSGIVADYPEGEGERRGRGRGRGRGGGGGGRPKFSHYSANKALLVHERLCDKMYFI